MRIISQILPRRFRLRLRRAFDSLYCRPIPDKETLGTSSSSQWTIVIRDMSPDAVIYSGGVGGDVTFEQELIRRFGVEVHIFDPSPIARNTIAQAHSEHLHFEPIGLSGSKEAKFSVGGGSDDKVWFKAGDGDAATCTSLPQEMEKNGHHSIDLLKIDIEGFEYEVLECCLAQDIPIKQICVEFHDFFPEIPKSKTKGMIRKLKSHGFDLIHRHRHDHTFLQRNIMP
ncbi:FkbM family methyltransferase [Alloacidobacterium sp.]|uniref:FkbM family methyltransferase n=1 Tax=Alloacidobacterium sp. TaxID=2951999 RepID=UPI002D3A27E7|nr:FkbM family methyltransferase [Alloacidobacterium sp.]HYK38222.1 FkbM family methyltransferase [Alloacidobacterium sp.]